MTQEERVKLLGYEKPGWTARLFGIETARLVACDAICEAGAWKRHEPFSFLYRSKRNVFFLLETESSWRTLKPEAAKALYDELPIQLDLEVNLFRQNQPPFLADDESQEEVFDVVRNVLGDYSVWPREVMCPDGWESIGVSGGRKYCLSYIEMFCIFGDSLPRR